MMSTLNVHFRGEIRKISTFRLENKRNIFLNCDSDMVNFGLNISEPAQRKTYKKSHCMTKPTKWHVAQHRL